MAKIIKCDQEEIAKVPNLMRYLYNYYGSNPLILYAVMDDDKKLNFIARYLESCVYIDMTTGNVKLIPFSLDENEQLSYVVLGDSKVYYGDGLAVVEDDDKYEALSFYENGYKDDANNGYVSYLQYDKKRNKRCELLFQQMYRNYNNVARPYLAFVRADSLDKVFIDNGDKSILESGHNFLNIMRPYFARVDIDLSSWCYDFQTIKEFGIFKVLKDTSYALQKNENSIKRFVKINYIDRNGYCSSVYPFTKTMKFEEIEHMVENEGFKVRIPHDLISIYNGSQEFIKMLRSLIEQMIKINEIEDEEKRMLLLVKGEEN